MGFRQAQGSLYIVVIVIGAVLILGTLFLMGRRTRMLKYTDKQFGFSMKYPVDWEVMDGADGVAVSFYSPLDGEMDLFRENVNLVIRDFHLDPKSLQEYADTAILQLQVVFPGGIHLLENKPALFGFKRGQRVIYTTEGSGPDLKIMHVFFRGDGVSYQLTYAATESQFNRYRPMADRIFKSFQM